MVVSSSESDQMQGSFSNDNIRDRQNILFAKRTHCTRSKEDTMMIEFTMAQEWTMRDMIFLPFIPTIIYGFFAINILSIHTYLYILGYESSEEGIIAVIIYIIEVSYTAHTTLIILHRLSTGYRQKYVHKPVHVLVLLLDIITTLPIKEVFRLIKRFTWNNWKYSRGRNIYLYSNKILRIIRLYTFYKDYTSDPGLNKKIILPLFHFIISTSLAQIIGVIYYYVSCYGCQIPNWTNNLLNFEFNKASSYNWLIICYCYTFSHQINNSIGFVNSGTISEMLLAMLSMIIGFMMQFMYLTGSLVSEYIQQMNFKFGVEKHLAKVKNFMILLNMPADLQDAVNMRFKLLWMVRKGVVRMPKIFSICPPSIQTEITTDIYWDAIMHSHIFSPFDDAFKRELSTVMKTEIYRAGEFLLKRGNMKSKMVYLVSGQIEVMSAENQKSSILSLSTGTILGETACLMPTRSNANIRCSTICQVHTLNCAHLGKLMTKYADLSTTVHGYMNKRIKYAKFKQDNLKKTGVKWSHIYWIKSQWRKLIKLRRNPSQKDTIYNSYFSSLFLDMLVLSSVEELKVHSICIRGKCSFIMDANSHFRHFINYVDLISILLQFFSTAYMIAFIGKINNIWYMLLTILDIIYFVDIYVQSITAVMVHNVLVTKPSEVLLLRSKSVTYLIDIVATLPYDLLGYVGGVSDYTVALLRIPKFLKLYKILLFFFEKQNTLTTYVIRIQVAKFVTLHLIILMTLVCATYMTNCIKGECLESGWLAIRKFDPGYNIKESLETLYHTTSIYLGLIVTQYKPGNLYDMVMFHAICIIGYYMNAFFFVQFCAAWGLLNGSKYYNRLKVTMMKEFLKDSKLGHLKHKILDQCKIHGSVNQNLRLEDTWHIIDQESLYLKNKVQQEFVLKILKKTEVFGSCSPRLLELLTNETKLFTIPPDHLIVKTNQRVSHLYIILQGFCKIKSSAPGDTERNQPSFHTKHAVFPVIEFFHQIDSFIEVKSETVVYVFGIPYVRFIKLLRVFPSEVAVFETALREHKNRFYNMLQRVVVSYMNTKTTTQSLGTVATFNYPVVQEGINRTLFARFASHICVTQWRKILNFIVFTTYNPTGKFFITYEIIHSVLIVIRITNLILTMQTLYTEQARKFLGIFLVFIEFTRVLDFYVRAHVQYYNEIGIKVTHPLSTLKHYLTTMFVVDLFADFPILYLNIHILIAPKHTEQSLFVLLFLTRPLLLYRPYLVLDYIENNILTKYGYVPKILRSFLFILLVVGVLCIMRLLAACPLTEGHHFYCPKNSWLGDDVHELSGHHFLLKNFYATLSLSTIGTFTMHTSRDYIINMITGTIIYILKLLFQSYVIGCCVFQNLKLARYQEAIKYYKLFSNQKVLSDTNKTEILEHYTNMWKKSNGEIPSKLFKAYYPLLMEDILMSLYKNTLEKCELFKLADIHFFRLLVPYLEERHFKKDAAIIRCNDVQDEIFIVYKGYANVYTAGLFAEVLHAGGMFGCFLKTGTTRQTIDVTSTVHVCMLVIKAERMYQILDHFPEIKLMFRNARRMNYEYLGNELSASHVSVSMKSFQSSVKHLALTSTNCFLRTISDNNKLIIIWDYITNMHVAPISVIVCLFVACVLEDKTMIEIWIPLDMYFLIYNYIKIHVRFTDSESGITITNLKLLILRYVKSFKCYVSIISFLPIYFLHTFKYKFIHKSGYFIVNKLVRVLYMMDYYMIFANKKNIPRHLRWAFLTYMSLIVIQIVFGMWWLVVDHTHDTDVTIQHIIDTYLHIINILTATGIPGDVLKEYKELMINGIVVISTQTLVIYMLVVFSKMLLLQNTHTNEYKIDAELFKVYCNKQQISPPIIKKSWFYLMYLFRTQRGEQFPALLKEAPPYIIQDHMETLYKKYIAKHHLFVYAHVDFVRQLYMHLKMTVYLPEDNIVEYGDRNETMFLIEEGRVASIDASEENKFHLEQLNKGVWFGELQGLSNVPHTKTYKALTVCNIVSLCKKDWVYLLQWFPATKETLLQMAIANFNAPKTFKI